jgi:hypothetical protein
MTKDINIKGFEWFLRPAFKDSVAQCKFEQGDVIYRDEPKGKERLGVKLQKTLTF